MALRNLSVWAYHENFGTLCRNARLDKDTGLSYPEGNTQGQSGWHVAIPFTSLDNLSKKLMVGVPMPSQYCGNWFSDCDPIQRGDILRLAIMAHGDKGGKIMDNGRGASSFLTASRVPEFHEALHNIGLYTRQGSTILLMGCLAGQGQNGTDLLVALSQVWPERHVVGFSTLGYRHPGAMKRRGEPCELPGMRDTEGWDEIAANPPAWDKQWSDFVSLPWASESSRHAKVVSNGVIEHYPEDETPKPKKQPSKSQNRQEGSLRRGQVR